MQLVFHNSSFPFQLLRIIGQTYYRGADIGECLPTANRIREGDIESWYNEWLKTANRVYGYAEDCISKRHKRAHETHTLGLQTTTRMALHFI